MIIYPFLLGVVPFGYDLNNNPIIDLPLVFGGLFTFILAFWLAFPKDRPRNYLPAAGISTLIATIFTFLSMIGSSIYAMTDTGYFLCPNAITPCPPAAAIAIFIFSVLGFVGGVIATNFLLKGKVHSSIFVGLTFLSISGVMPILLNVFTWGFFTWSVLAFSAVSFAFVVLSRIEVMKAANWRLVGMLSGGFGVVAIFLGFLFYSIIMGDDGLSWRPYGDIGLPLIVLGMSGILVTHISMNSIHSGLDRFLPTKPKQFGAPVFFQMAIIVIAVNLSLASALSVNVLGPALLGPSFFQCSCGRTEQLTITQLTFTSSSVTFNLANSGTSPVTITLVQVQGSGVPSGTYTYVSAVVKAGGTLDLVVTFSGLAFQSGIQYDFTLTSSDGNKFPTSGIA